MTSTTLTLDFKAMAREVAPTSSDRPLTIGLIPAEANSRMQREGQAFRQPNTKGTTVDQEGLMNNYGLEPEVYFATPPSLEQARQYGFQGFFAAMLVVSLVITAALVG